MLDHGVGVLKAGLDIRLGELREISFADLLKAQTRLQQIKHLPHHDTGTPDHRFAVANPWIHLDTMKRRHVLSPPSVNTIPCGSFVSQASGQPHIHQ